MKYESKLYTSFTIHSKSPASQKFFLTIIKPDVAKVDITSTRY